MNQKEFVKELGKLRPSATFLSVMKYCNEYSEVADYSIVFHMSYEKALKRSLIILEGLVPASDVESEAKYELIESFNKSLHKLDSTPMEELEDHYVHFKNEDGSYIKGIKFHDKSGILHLYGLVNHKRIIMPGIYPNKEKRPLTIAKDKLRRLCPVGKFRQFRIQPERVDRISVEGLELLPPSN